MVAVLILNYNNATDTINCIESVEKFNTSKNKYIIIDNGSTDNSVLILDSYFSTKYHVQYRKYDISKKTSDCDAPYISLLCIGKNTGYAQGNNYGLKFIENDKTIDQILILNNDIIFIEDIIPKLSEFLNTTANAAIVSPLLLKRDGLSIDYNCARANCKIFTLFLLYLFHNKDYFGLITKAKHKQYYLLKYPELINLDSFKIELPSGSCMLINKELFKRINYFDPSTFLYYEENILFKKISNIGLYNYILPNIKCIHLGAQSVHKVKRNYFHDKYSNSSAYYYLMNYCNLNSCMKLIFTVIYKIYMSRLYLRKLIKQY